MSVNTVLLYAGQTRITDQDPPNQQTTLTMTLTHARTQTNYHLFLMVVWTMLTITRLLSEKYIYIIHNDDVCDSQKRLMYNIELTSSIIHIFVKTVIMIIIHITLVILTLNVPNIVKAHDPTIYINLSKLTEQLKNLTARTTPKILSAFPNSSTHTDCKKLKPTYLERAKFSPSTGSKNVVFNPFPSVKSMKNQSENTSKCKHVLHFGFVLVTSGSPRLTSSTPKQLYFITGAYGDQRKVAHSEEPGSAMYTHRENKYIHKVSRFENKVYETLLNRTKMHIFTTNNGKNTSNNSNPHSTLYGQRTFSGIPTKLPPKQSKYQPFKCMSKYIIMIIDHNILCIHVRDPPHRLLNITPSYVKGLKHTKKGHTTTKRLKIMIYCLNNTNHLYG